MQVFHFSFSVNGAVPPKAAATALADGADAVGTRRELPLPPFNLEVALADAPWNKARTATLISGAAGHPDGSDAGHPDAGHPWNKAGTAAAGHWDAGHPWNKAGTAAAGHSDGADVATAKMFANISGQHAKVSQEATEDCCNERILCANASRQAREYMLAAAKALAKAAAMQQAAPALRPPKQAAVVKKAAPRPSAKKAAAFQKAPPLRHPKQAAAMMKATVPKKAAPPRIRLARVQ